MAGFFNWLAQNWLVVLLVAGIIVAVLFIYSKRNELFNKN